MSHQLQIISSAQAAGAAADDRDALAGGGWTDRCRYISCHIHSYTFDTADIDRIIQHVAAAAGLTWMFAYQRTGGWEWVRNAGQGSQLMGEMQSELGVTVDGLFGPKTANALIARYANETGCIQDGKLDAESATIKAMQQHLNAGAF